MYTICHNLLLAKLRAYGVGEKGIDFLYSYLSGRKQRVKVNGVFVGLATSVLWGHACLMYLSTIWIFLFNSLPWGSMLMTLPPTHPIQTFQHWNCLLSKILRISHPGLLQIICPSGHPLFFFVYRRMHFLILGRSDWKKKT